MSKWTPVGMPKQDSGAAYPCLSLAEMASSKEEEAIARGIAINLGVDPDAVIMTVDDGVVRYEICAWHYQIVEARKQYAAHKTILGISPD